MGNLKTYIEDLVEMPIIDRTPGGDFFDFGTNKLGNETTAKILNRLTSLLSVEVTVSSDKGMSHYYHNVIEINKGLLSIGKEYKVKLEQVKNIRIQVDKRLNVLAIYVTL